MFALLSTSRITIVRTYHRIVGLLPQRRRRFWRYVSPSRRGLGLLLLAFLTLLTYGYWYQTNDRRIRHKARRYLRTLTAGPVDIRRASFSFFGGIELEQVRLHFPGGRKQEPLFRARKVVLRHRPWLLMAGGPIRPKEIVCLEPVVTVEYDAETGAYRARELLKLIARRRKELALARTGPMELPDVQLRGGKLRVIDVIGEQRSEPVETPIEVSMTLRSGADSAKDYRITFEEPGENSDRAMQAEVVVDLDEGRIKQVSGTVPLERLGSALPAKYRRWSRRYQIEGNVTLAQTGPSDKGKVLSAKLEAVSMSFPPEEGGLNLQDVTGHVNFETDRVTLTDIHGRMPQAGNARLTVNGQYGGYQVDAPFEVTVAVDEISLPASGVLSGRLDGILEDLRETYHPEGPINISFVLRRDEQGKLSYAGTGRPQGISMLFKHFPYRIEDVRGELVFQEGLIELKDLTAQRGGATCTIRGKVFTRPGERTLYDVTVKAKDVLLDEEFRSAIPEEFQPVWRSLSPAGQTGIEGRVYRLDGDAGQQVEVHLAMDGKGSVAYEGFPYRIEKLVGNAYISGRNARIVDVHAMRGPASCRIDGVLKNVGTPDSDLELTIVGKDLPLDGALVEAIEAASKQGALAMAEAGLDGSVDNFRARVWQKNGEQLDYSIVADAKDVSLRLRQFPYEVTSASGVVTIRPGRVIVEGLGGHHGPSAISASGQVYLADKLGMDFRVSAKNIRLDAALAEALPEGFRRIWQRLSPSGLADMTVSLTHSPPDAPGRHDYEFILDAHEVGITSVDFPYPLRGISGRVVARPGRVEFEELSARSGEMRGEISGFLTHLPEGDRAKFAISATSVPIDAELLNAIPGEFAVLAENFEPGGDCDVDLQDVDIIWPKVGPTTQATQPTDNRQATRWSMAGKVVLRGARANVGMGRKIVTGQIAGAAQRDSEGLALQAGMDMSTIIAGKHGVSDLRGKLTKSAASSVMKLENISGKAHGGRLAGFALIEVAKPLSYRLNLLVDQVRIEGLFAAAGIKGSQEASGVIAGRIELSEISGVVESRQASGVLRISEAKLYGRLPIFLDLLTVVYLAMPGKGAFNEGGFSYHMRGDKLVLREINLRGPTISLVGSGTMSMKTKELNLHFLTGPPGRLPRLSGLANEVLTGILREIVEVEVTGTLAQPKTRTRTLASLEDAIHRLTAPSLQQ